MSSGLLSQAWCCSSTNNIPQFVPPHQHNKSLFIISNFKLFNNPTKFRCYNNTTSAGPPPGESDSKSVLDAFFLGKALAEAVNERIESAVGEFLSNIGRLQAEQQKQVQDFQDEVLERAKKAKEMAAREAMEAQGVIHKPSTDIVSAAGDDTESVTIITPRILTDTDPGRDEEDSVSVPIDD